MELVGSLSTSNKLSPQAFNCFVLDVCHNHAPLSTVAMTHDSKGQFPWESSNLNVHTIVIKVAMLALCMVLAGAILVASRVDRRLAIYIMHLTMHNLPCTRCMYLKLFLRFVECCHDSQKYFYESNLLESCVLVESDYIVVDVDVDMVSTSTLLKKISPLSTLLFVCNSSCGYKMRKWREAPSSWLN